MPPLRRTDLPDPVPGMQFNGPEHPQFHVVLPPADRVGPPIVFGYDTPPAAPRQLFVNTVPHRGMQTCRRAAVRGAEGCQSRPAESPAAR
ncbi:hypothetical protein GCM10012284_63410 [Mangrovihabitans endophyticus]|uniref:Uncharacterized protein n=1 Tax=Mangrovihabitans endophyticus TaxID=1751298 RepID=A0A8J3FRX9_9ACTN|nr:hypothetical protein GCM10012284_63410 [Mangrovihabitans endophyticus]